LRFLVDNALSPLVAEGLARRGHDAIHVRDLAMADAPDAKILARAREDRRIVVTADLDFGALLGALSTRTPSLLLFRKGTQRSSAAILALLDAHLPSVQADLERGAVVVFEPGRYRVRVLPILPGS
jgi:predicted nuclease of predicted toxin-antitoxin system